MANVRSVKDILEQDLQYRCVCPKCKRQVLVCVSAQVVCLSCQRVMRQDRLEPTPVPVSSYPQPKLM